MICPVDGNVLFSPCQKSDCMNNHDGNCAYAAVLSCEGDDEKTLSMFSVSAADLKARLKSIKTAIIAEEFFCHVTGRSVIEGREKDFLTVMDSESSYVSWNRQITVPFSEIRSALATLKSRL